MVALKIEDAKAFTNGLFVGNLFDAFPLREAEITTYNRFTIDGRISRGYYSEEERAEKGLEDYSFWSTIRPICFSLVKGKRLPESFRLVFQLDREKTAAFINSRVTGIQPEQVNGLYINVHFENKELKCVSGTSLKIFTLDKILENEWDEWVKRFLKENKVAFSIY